MNAVPELSGVDLARQALLAAQSTPHSRTHRIDLRSACSSVRNSTGMVSGTPERRRCPVKAKGARSKVRRRGQARENYVLETVYWDAGTARLLPRLLRGRTRGLVLARLSYGQAGGRDVRVPVDGLGHGGLREDDDEPVRGRGDEVQLGVVRGPTHGLISWP